jgi:hypothetical protein
MTSAKLKGVRCVVTGMGGVPRLVAVGMGVTVAVETSVAQTLENADSRACLSQRLRGQPRDRTSWKGRGILYAPAVW